MAVDPAIQMMLSESTAARRRLPVRLLASGAGVTAQTGTVRISKNGGASAASTNSLVEIDATNMPGDYYVELTAAELDTLGTIAAHYDNGSVEVWKGTVHVVAFNPFADMGQVWDATRAAHATSGTFGEKVAGVAGNVDGSVGSLSAQAKADVNAEVVDVVKIDTIPELTQAQPPATPTMHQAIMFPYMSLRNESVQDSSASPAVLSVKNDAGTVVAKQETTDASNVLTRGKFQAGP